MLRVAVIGGGPAGVYASDILLRHLSRHGEELGLGANARIDVFERLPVPFGLVRYGVAPDHPNIKYIAGALEKTLDNPRIHLYADVEYGRDVLLDDLLQRYDAVLFATGAIDDRPLRVSGHDLAGVFGAAHFVAWYDGYPYSPLRDWPLNADHAAVIGGGNVSMDVARMLLRRADDLLSTDIPGNVYRGIRGNRLRVLHHFVRRGPAQAKFSVQELRELEKLPGVQIIVDRRDFDLDAETLARARQDKLTRQMLDELFKIRDLAERMQGDGGTDSAGNPASHRYMLHFYSSPEKIVGEEGAVTDLRVQRTRVDPDGHMAGTGAFTDYAVHAVYHAIGYEPARIPGIPYDERLATLANVGGRILNAPQAIGGRPIPRLYATGWAKRGPVGLIGSTKSDAMETIANLCHDLSLAPGHGRIAPDRADGSIDQLLAARGIRPIDFAGWKRVDAYERARGARVGRTHIKVTELAQMRSLAAGRSLVA